MGLYIHQQCHGYKNGHEVLGASIRLQRSDQDAVDRLSDVSGSLSPGEIFAPYLTAYPLPSGLFYVLSKTWQDLAAPRAGCVLTRSLLLRTEDWESLRYVSSLLDLLTPIDKEHVDAEQQFFEEHSVLLAPVLTDRVIDLVEALFLEDRKPIAIFDEREAETIGLRLLTALWPAMRRNFSVCTFALSPRTIGGKSFDLVFSTKGARSRFARWDGRQVESPSDMGRTVRHRWTEMTAKQIFEDPTPGLISLDQLGVLKMDSTGDEANLRLTLLWNELLTKSEQSPTAILGLLDILNSRSNVSTELTKFIPLISKAIDLALGSLPPAANIDFLLTLVGKFSSRWPPIRLLNKIRFGLAVATQADPTSVVSLLADASGRRHSDSAIVSAGIGDGLASLDAKSVVPLVSRLPRETILRFLAYSRLFAELAMQTVETVRSEDWTRLLRNALTYPDPELRVKARRRVVPLLAADSQAPILAAVLTDVNPAALISIVKRIWSTTRFRIPSFDEVFVRAVHSHSGLSDLRSAILATNPSKETDRFLLKTISPNSVDIGWLCNDANIPEKRRIDLLLAALSNASDREMQALAQTTDLSASLESLLAAKLPDSVRPLTQILIFGALPTDRLLADGQRVLPLVDRRTRGDLVFKLLSKAFRDPGVTEDQLIDQVINTAEGDITPHQLIEMATSPHASPVRLSHNLIVLSRTTSDIRRGILINIADLTDRLLRRGAGSLTREGITAWSQMLMDSGSVNFGSQLKAASGALSFALKAKSRPVSPLIVAAFPIVYNELKAGKETPSLLSFFFTDWDRCKTARRDLVQAFMNSDWPPTDLVRAAIPTGDLEEIVDTILNEGHGNRYLASIETDLENLPVEMRSRIQAELSNSRHVEKSEKSSGDF